MYDRAVAAHLRSSGTSTGGLDTARALTMTQVSAASGALTWLIIEAIIYRKATALGFASGILAGLVAITPAAGVVMPYGVIIIGAVSSLICFYALVLKSKIGYDDSLDCFGIHGVGSCLGVILLTFFIRDSWMRHAAEISGHPRTMWNQLSVQAVGAVATILFSATATFVICWIVEKTVGFRISAEAEAAGLDSSVHGEYGYGYMQEY